MLSEIEKSDCSSDMKQLKRPCGYSVQCGHMIYEAVNDFSELFILTVKALDTIAE